jgi:hypothetical protein
MIPSAGDAGLVDGQVGSRGQTSSASKAGELSNQRALAFVALITCASALIHVVVALVHPAPWITPDELIYSELAKSIAGGSLPSVRDEPTLGYGLLYPLIISPAWAIFGDPANAYIAAKVINALVMSLAAFPAFLLARRFVSAGNALLVATFAVFIPSMLLSGTLLVEPVLYPVFLLALFAFVASLQNPTRRNQLLAIAAIGLACSAKPLSLILAPAYVLAVLHLGFLDRRRGGTVRARLRTQSTALTALACIGGLAIAVPMLLGDADAVLGVYGVVLRHIDFSGTLVWFIRHLAGLALYVAIVPFAASLAIVAATVTRRCDPRLEEFAAVATWTIGGTLVALGAYSSKPLAGAAGYMPSEARLHERNMFVLVPLLLLGLALFTERRALVSRRLVRGALLVSVALPVLLPLEKLLNNANFQAFAVIPWSAGDLARFWPFTFLPLALLACLALSSPPASVALRSWALVGLVFAVTTMSAHASMTFASQSASTVGIGEDTRWIDHALAADSADSNVVVLWISPRGETDVGRAERTIWMSEFFNRSVGNVIEVGAPTPYELPHEDGHLHGGLVRLDSGGWLQTRYVLAPCWVAIDGEVVARDPHVGWNLYHVRRGPTRVTSPWRPPTVCVAQVGSAGDGRTTS